jgi:hypothetical protein
MGPASGLAGRCLLVAGVAIGSFHDHAPDKKSKKCVVFWMANTQRLFLSYHNKSRFEKHFL